MRMFALFTVLVLCANGAALPNKGVLQKKASTKPLAGLVVIIDPGHGGTDPGESGNFGDGIRFDEYSYCYDTALRLEKLARLQGAVVYLTVRNPAQLSPVNNYPGMFLPSGGNGLFALTGEQVRPGNGGVLTRVRYANKVLAEHPSDRVVFISLHFDETRDSEMQGVTVITPRQEETPGLAEFLAETFRRSTPILHSGDESQGVHHLIILRGKDDSFHRQWNHVSQKVVVELGNFSNATDVRRIRDPKTRGAYAKLIAIALAKVNKLPVEECR